MKNLELFGEYIHSPLRKILILLSLLLTISGVGLTLTELEIFPSSACYVLPYDTPITIWEWEWQLLFSSIVVICLLLLWHRSFISWKTKKRSKKIIPKEKLDWLKGEINGNAVMGVILFFTTLLLFGVTFAMFQIGLSGTDETAEEMLGKILWLVLGGFSCLALFFFSLGGFITTVQKCYKYEKELKELLQ